MRRSQLGLMVGAPLAAALFALSGCANPVASASDGGEEPAVVEPVEGTDLSSVTLSEQASERLGIETATVTAAPGGSGTRMPYGALLYDASGKTWAFVNTEPLMFVREQLTVDDIRGDWVYLSAGPPVGTTVVTVGAAELLGAELGVDH